jgi:dephospho-CoA kinase
VHQKHHKPLRVGLTGGIASGKTTVADMFAELGVPVIDTDVIAREVVQPGQPALEEIRSEFGAEIIDADGMLDRAAMRKIVFVDDDARRRLEAILHPRIREATVRQAEVAGGDYQLIVVPLLVESPTRAFVDRVLVVDCNEEVQVARLFMRDAETQKQAQRMLAAQAGRADRLAIADDVISNDGDLQETRAQVRSLHQEYLRQAAKRVK